MRRPVPCRPCANAASPRSASAQMMISCSWSSSFLSCGGSSAVQGQRTRSAAKIYNCSARSANALARLRGRRETGNRPNSERRARKGRLSSAERTSRQPPSVRSYDHVFCLAMEASMSSNTSFSPIVWKAPKYFIAVAQGGLLTQRCGEAESAERKIETMTENETTRSTQ